MSMSATGSIPYDRLCNSEKKKRRCWGDNNINNGRLREFPWICIDKFYGDHLQATTFFLTHCHVDHMVGLDEEAFWNRLQESEVRLYMQYLSPDLLGLFGRYLRGKDGIQSLIQQNKLIPLPAYEEFEIDEPVTGTQIKLTLLPAAHCPGSVMLLIEYDDSRILYTGDCRTEVKDLMKLKSLHETRKLPHGKMEWKVKRISHLYVDTTFCSSRSQDFPERKDAVAEMLVHVGNWIKKDPENCLCLCFSGIFSHEYVMLKLYEEFKIKCHVNNERFEAYRKVKELQKSVTLSPNTKFHLCGKEEACVANWTSGKDEKVLKIRLSSLWYMKNEDGSGPLSAVHYSRDKGQVTLCYSMHSSLDEIGFMIDYLRPSVVTPLVTPPRGTQRNEIKSELCRNVKWKFVYEDYIKEMESETILKVKKGTREDESREAQPGPVLTSERERERERRKKIKFRWTPSPPPPSKGSRRE